MGRRHASATDDEDERGKKEVREALIHVLIKLIIFTLSLVIAVLFTLYFSFLYI